MSDKIKDLKAKYKVLDQEYEKSLSIPRLIRMILGFTFLSFFGILGLMEAPIFFLGALFSCFIWGPPFRRMRKFKRYCKAIGNKIADLEKKEKEEAEKKKQEEKNKPKEENKIEDKKEDPKPAEDKEKKEPPKPVIVYEVIKDKDLVSSVNIPVNTVVNEASDESEMSV